jgi:hypothetical protein
MSVAKSGDLLVQDQGVGLDTFTGGSCSGGGWSLNSTISSSGDDWVDAALRPGNGIVAVSDAGNPSGTGQKALSLNYPSGTVVTTFNAPGQSLPIGIETTGYYHN